MIQNTSIGHLSATATRTKNGGDWLHKALETYKIPKRIIAAHADKREIPKRLFPVFRDREELPTATDLSENINKALADSHYLIVICSPNSAKSQYVNEEIKTFKALGRENKILSVIVDGEPNALDKPELGLKECFPEAIKFRVTSDRQITSERTEPIAADARKGKDGKRNALLKLVAGVLRIDYAGLKDREQERKRRNQIITSVVMVSLMLVFAGLAWLSWRSYQRAEKEKHKTQQTFSRSDFLQGLPGWNKARPAREWIIWHGLFARIPTM